MITSDNARPKILVVEDERITAHYLRQSLTRVGYQVVAIASNGADALREAQTARPDLLIADIGLEGDMEGIEVANRVRQRWGIPTVFLTAYSDQETMRRARFVEPYGYLVKPFSIEELQATIEIALQQQGLNQLRLQQAEASARTLQRTREDLGGLATRLFTIQEDERERLARDLHDDINQRLAALAIDMELQRQKLSKKWSPATKVAFAALITRLNGITDDLRVISHQLHPAAIRDLGLSAALRELANEFQERYAIPTQFSSREVPDPLPEAISICCYRIAQEALQNVAKHSHAASLTVAVMGMDGVRMLIRDDGDGFDIEATRRAGGLGLISMAQRAELLEGTFELDSEPGRGTRIHVHIPIPRAGEPREIDISSSLVRNR